MKRHAPGGYEPHGPPQHQVRPHLPQQTRPAQCTFLGSSQSLWVLPTVCQHARVHGCSAAADQSVHVAQQGYGGPQDNGAGADQDGYGMRNKQRRV